MARDKDRNKKDIKSNKITEIELLELNTKKAKEDITSIFKHAKKELRNFDNQYKSSINSYSENLKALGHNALSVVSDINSHLSSTTSKIDNSILGLRQSYKELQKDIHNVNQANTTMEFTGKSNRNITDTSSTNSERLEKISLDGASFHESMFYNSTFHRSTFDTVTISNLNIPRSFINAEDNKLKKNRILDKSGVPFSSASEDNEKLFKNITTEKLIANELRDRSGVVGSTSSNQDESAENKPATGTKSLGDNIKTALIKSSISAAKVFTDTLTQGVSNYLSAYESNFNNIAARMGTYRDETYQNIKSINQSVIATNNQTVNLTKDLLPAMAKVAEQGLLGESALNKATSDALDKKIVPWLETSSEAYVNMAVNMSDSDMMIWKSMQIQLQETQAGNRLLQTGVINSLTSELEPLLRNIDFNTGGSANLAAESQALMASMVESGMSTKDAYEYVSKLANVAKDEYGAYTSGDPMQILAAQGFTQGKSLGEVSDQLRDTIGVMLKNADSNIDVGAIAHKMAITLPAYTKEVADLWYEGTGNWQQMMLDVNDEAYRQRSEDSAQFVTTTEATKNAMENISANALQWVAAIPMGADFFPITINLLKGILGSLVADKILGVTGGSLGKEGATGLFKELLKKTKGFSGGTGGATTSVLSKGLSAGKAVATNPLTWGAAGAAWAGLDAYKMSQRADDMDVSTSSAALGGFLGGSGAGLTSDASGIEKTKNIASGATKYAGMGAMIGSFIAPGIGTAIGAAGGAVIGATLSAIGPEDLAKGIDGFQEGLADAQDALFGWAGSNAAATRRMSMAMRDFTESTEALKKSQDKSLEGQAKNYYNLETLESKKRNLIALGIKTEEETIGMTESQADNLFEHYEAMMKRASEIQQDTTEDSYKDYFKAFDKKLEESKKTNNEAIYQDLQRDLAVAKESNDYSVVDSKLSSLGYNSQDLRDIKELNTYDQAIKKRAIKTRTKEFTDQDFTAYLTDYNIGGSQLADRSVVEQYYKTISNLDGQIAAIQYQVDNTEDGSRKESLQKQLDELNKQKLEKQRAKESDDTLKYYAAGSSYISESGIAYLHEGESVLNKQTAQQYRQVQSMVNHLSVLSKLGNPMDKLFSNSSDSSSKNNTTDDGMKSIVERSVDRLIKAIENSTAISSEESKKDSPKQHMSFNSIPERMNSFVRLEPTLSNTRVL